MGVLIDGSRADALGRYVLPSEDQEHEGVYTPDLRDQAETGRNFLLNALLDTPGAEAYKIILDLAQEQAFASFSDRLRLLARQRAASDAEGAALKPEEIVALEESVEVPPSDRDGLFAVMMERLDDLAHDISHGPFTDRRTLRTIQEEIEMQRTLAGRLQNVGKGAYTVSREDEVADLKKPDIQLSTKHGEQQAVIEVKIADSWSLDQLEQALRTQLVGQYLRHRTCRAGCLLLTYNGEKKFWIQTDTGSRLSFPEVVESLRSLARAIEEERRYEIRLGVFPLDLTDPPL